MLRGDYNKVIRLDKDLAVAKEYILTKVALLVQNNAKINAPYLSGDLKTSISTKFDRLSQGIVVIGSPLAYARRREYENYKNPHKKFYLYRGYSEHTIEIGDIITKALYKEFEP